MVCSCFVSVYVICVFVRQREKLCHIMELFVIDLQLWKSSIEVFLHYKKNQVVFALANLTATTLGLLLPGGYIVVAKVF